MSNLFDLTGKNALVTGSHKGLGAAIAIALAQAGANVAVHGRSGESQPVMDAVRKAGSNAIAVMGDISDAKACEEIIDASIRGLGGLDVLVNNAGIIRRTPAAEYSAQDWNDVIEVNLNSVFRLCQLAGREMLKQGSGKIINIASLLSFQGGVAQLTKALANEWASKGINVNGIAPGYMATDNTAALRADEKRSRQILERIPAGRWGDPEDITGAAVFLASSASDYIHGHLIVVDGGWMGR